MRRYFNISQPLDDKVGFYELTEIFGPRVSLITAIDIDEDGKAEIVCQDFSENGRPRIKIIYNNLYLDMFFLKVFMFEDIE